MNSLLLAVLYLWVQPLFADTINLKDGTSVQGSILSANAERIELRTANGTMVIPRERIASIDLSSTEAAPIAPAAPTVAPAAPLAPPPSILLRRRPPPAYREAPGFGPGADILSLQLGLSIPVSQVSFSAIGGGSAVNGDVGVATGVQYLHQLDSRLGLGVELAYADRSPTDSFGLLPSAVAHVSGDSLVFLGVARWNLSVHGLARPYLLGGLGGHLTSEIIDARPLPGYVWGDTQTDETRRLIDDDLWAFASCLRFGVDFFPDRPMALGFDLSWLHLMGGTYQATPAGQALGLTGVSGSVDIISLATRIGFVL